MSSSHLVRGPGLLMHACVHRRFPENGRGATPQQYRRDACIRAACRATFSPRVSRRATPRLHTTRGSVGPNCERPCTFRTAPNREPRSRESRARGETPLLRDKIRRRRRGFCVDNVTVATLFVQGLRNLDIGAFRLQEGKADSV
ncbi:hypothetical protein MTO96_025775 [Rhipicephalus appendiculatus]